MQCAVNFSVRHRLIRANESFSSVNICQLMISKCNCPVESKQKKKKHQMNLGLGHLRKKQRFEPFLLTLWINNSITYLWRPMRLCWWVRPCLAFRSWFPDFLWEYLSNVGWWFWFLHINNACVFLFVTENGVFGPATCCVFLKFKRKQEHWKIWMQFKHFMSHF